MICSVHTTGLNGINGSHITVECYITNGLPAFDIVGLPDTAVKEARERVRAAVKTCGMKFPASRITINLAPAHLKKTGTHYDLPILLGVLAASGAVRRPKSNCAFMGELSLDGQIRPINGVLPMALAAKRAGMETLFVPAQNAAEATLSRGPAIIPVNNIKEIVTKKNDVMAFIKASDEYKQIDLTLFPKIYKENKNLEVYNIVKIYGKVEKRFDNYQIIVSKIINLTRSKNEE